jgi:hypothetical protein
MENIEMPSNAHRNGETKTTLNSPRGSWLLDTPGGRFHAEWDVQSPVTRDGQLLFFFSSFSKQ